MSHNGNISAFKWKGTFATAGATGQRSYKFNYSKVDRLLGATYQKFGSNVWDKEVNTLNETQNYDHNGNIQGLQRNQILRTDFNAGYNSQAGLSKSIKVYPGDVIHAEVYAKYWNQSTNKSNLTMVSDLSFALDWVMKLSYVNSS